MGRTLEAEVASKVPETQGEKHRPRGKRTLRDHLVGVGDGGGGGEEQLLGACSAPVDFCQPLQLRLSFELRGLSLWILVPASAALFLTCVDKAAGGSFTKLLGLVGEGHFYHPRDVSRWRLHPDGVGRDEL